MANLALPATAMLCASSAIAGPVRTEFTPPFTEAELAVYPEARGMPGDVQLFIIKWSDCVHWRGEEPFDEKRRREINAAVVSVCTGVDAMRADVLRRHTNDAAVLERLRSYTMLDR